MRPVGDDTRERVNYLDLALITPPDGDNDAAADAGKPEHADAILRVLAEQPDRSVGSERALLAAMRAAGARFRRVDAVAALDDLIHAGTVETTSGPNRAKGYRLRECVPKITDASASRSASACASPYRGGRGTHTPSASGTHWDAPGRTCSDDLWDGYNDPPEDLPTHVGVIHESV